jgi:hypothetical protein
LHGHCKVAGEEVKPFGIGCIDFEIEGDQNVPDEKGESSDWGYSIGQ